MVVVSSERVTAEIASMVDRPSSREVTLDPKERVRGHVRNAVISITQAE